MDMPLKAHPFRGNIYRTLATGKEQCFFEKAMLIQLVCLILFISVEKS